MLIRGLLQGERERQSKCGGLAEKMSEWHPEQIEPLRARGQRGDDRRIETGRLDQYRLPLP